MDEKEIKARQKAAENAITQIVRQYGKGSIMRLGDDTRQDVPTIPTGSLGLDIGAAASSRSTVRSRRARRRWRRTSSPTRSRLGGWRRSSTLSTRSIPNTPAPWA